MNKLPWSVKFDLIKLGVTALVVPQAMVILTLLLLWKMRKDRQYSV